MEILHHILNPYMDIPVVWKCCIMLNNNLGFCWHIFIVYMSLQYKVIRYGLHIIKMFYKKTYKKGYNWENKLPLIHQTVFNSINFFKIYSFDSFYFWLRWVFVAAHRLSLAAVSGSHFLLRWLLLLWSTGSRCTGFSSCGSQVLERRLNSCGARA